MKRILILTILLVSMFLFETCEVESGNIGPTAAPKEFISCIYQNEISGIKFSDICDEINLVHADDSKDDTKLQMNTYCEGEGGTVVEKSCSKTNAISRCYPDQVKIVTEFDYLHLEEYLTAYIYWNENAYCYDGVDAQGICSNDEEENKLATAESLFFNCGAEKYKGNYEQLY